MASVQSNDFQRVDAALAVYYQNLGHNDYINPHTGHGKFMQYIIDQELNDEELPIESELGDDCDPTDCAYSWIHHDTEFPIPSDVHLSSNQQKEAFIFYVLQYCYKNGQPPSEQYIRSTLAPQSGVAVAVNSIQPYSDHQAESDSASFSREPSDENAEGAPQFNDVHVSHIEPAISKIAEIEFKPKYPARAHLNIFTAKEIIKKLREIMSEDFENELISYYYTDISTALQINDKQMRVFTLRVGDQIKKLSIINYDLHLKGSDGEYLYGVIVPNDNYQQMKQNKWLWKLDDFMTADTIERKFKIKRYELPKSSRQMPAFLRQLQQNLVIEESLIDNTDWFNVQQIKSLKRNVKIPKVIITLSKDMWITECKKSFQNVELPLIPVVVNKNNKHWIEWVKIIHIESQNVYVGVSIKFDDANGWSVKSICLDRTDICNKHRLVGLNRNRYNIQLENFKTSITKIKFSDNENQDFNKKMNALKQQIRSQQDSICRLKQSLLRANNGNKYIINNDATSDCDKWLEQLIDDVITNKSSL